MHIVHMDEIAENQRRIRQKLRHLDLTDASNEELEKVKFKQLSSGAIMPTRADDFSKDGFILYSAKDYVIPARSTCMVDTGVGLSEIPEDIFFWLIGEHGRGGFYYERKLMAYGLYDSAFKSSMECRLKNFGDTSYHIRKGEKICRGSVLKTVIEQL